MAQAEARGPTTTTDTDAGAGPLRTFIVDMLLPKELERSWVCKLIEAGRPPWGCSCSVFILLGNEGIYLLGKGFSHEQGEDQGGVSIDLDRLCMHPNFAPRHSFVRPGTRVGAIKLLGCVDVNSIVGSVPLWGGAEQAVSQDGHTHRHTHTKRALQLERLSHLSWMKGGAPT